MLAVVVMSYAARLRTLPLVVNKLGSCPSGGWVVGGRVHVVLSLPACEPVLGCATYCVPKAHLWGGWLRWHGGKGSKGWLGCGRGAARASCTSPAPLLSHLLLPAAASATSHLRLLDLLRCAQTPPYLQSPALLPLPFAIRRPAVAEVLVVWNGADPPPPSHFSSRVPVRVRQEEQVWCVLLSWLVFFFCDPAQPAAALPSRFRSQRYLACAQLGGLGVHPSAAHRSPAGCRGIFWLHGFPSCRPQMDLSNRLRADEGIRTAAVFLCDDDVLLR